MKCKKVIFVLLMMFLLICSGSLHVFSMNIGFSTIEMTEEKKERFFANFHVSLLQEEPEKLPIECFDISEKGWSAIGTGTDLDKFYVSVYDENGKFQYAYVFETFGTIGVHWDGDNVIIYLVRGHIAISYSPEGTLVEIREVENTSENGEYLRKFILTNKKTINGNEYRIKNNMGILNPFVPNYSQLVRTDSEGNETILYDVNSDQLLNAFLTLIFVLMIVFLVIGMLKSFIDDEHIRGKHRKSH